MEVGVTGNRWQPAKISSLLSHSKEFGTYPKSSVESSKAKAESDV